MNSSIFGRISELRSLASELRQPQRNSQQESFSQSPMQMNDYVEQGMSVQCEQPIVVIMQTPTEAEPIEIQQQFHQVPSVMIQESDDQTNQSINQQMVPPQQQQIQQCQSEQHQDPQHCPELQQHLTQQIGRDTYQQTPHQAESSSYSQPTEVQQGEINYDQAYTPDQSRYFEPTDDPKYYQGEWEESSRNEQDEYDQDAYNEPGQSFINNQGGSKHYFKPDQSEYADNGQPKNKQTFSGKSYQPGQNHQSNRYDPDQSYNPDQSQSGRGQSYRPGQSQSGQGQSYKPDQSRCGPGQSYKPDQSSRDQSYKPDQSRSGPGQSYKPDQTQSGRGQSYKQDQSKSGRALSYKPDQSRSGPGQSYKPDQSESSRDQSYKPNHSQSGQGQSYKPDQYRSGPGQSYKPDQSQSRRFQSYKPDHSQSGQGQSYKPDQTQPGQGQSDKQDQSKSGRAQSYKPDQARSGPGQSYKPDQYRSDPGQSYKPYQSHSSQSYKPEQSKLGRGPSYNPEKIQPLKPSQPAQPKNVEAYHVKPFRPALSASIPSNKTGLANHGRAKDQKPALENKPNKSGMQKPLGKPNRSENNFGSFHPTKKNTPKPVSTKANQSSKVNPTSQPAYRRK